MEQNDNDLPAKVDAVLGGLVGFTYRLVGTLFSCLFNPRIGPLRAYVRRRLSPRPTTALVAAAALVALSSLSGPLALPELVVRDERQFLRFLIFAVVLYISFDAVLLFCARVFEPYSARRRARALGVLRYGASGLLLAWFLSAIIVGVAQISPTSEIGAFAKPFADLLRIPTVSLAVDGLAAAPLFLSVLSLTRSQWRTQLLRRAQLLLAYAALAGFAFLLNSYGPRASYPIADFLGAKAVRQSPSSTGIPDISAASMPKQEANAGEIVADPVICRISPNGSAQVEFALLNESGRPAAIALSGFRLNVAAAGWTLLDPKTVDAPLQASSQAIVTLNGKEAKILLLKGSLNLKKGLPDLTKGWCTLGHSDAKLRVLNARIESVADASIR